MAASTVIDEIPDGVVPDHEYHGIKGIWFTWPAWQQVVLNVKLQQRDLQVALATETTGREIAENDAKKLREAQARTAWAATYGPWLGLIGGGTFVGILAAVLGGVFKAAK